jgi:hypothetical protein
VNKDQGTCPLPEPGVDQGGEHGFGKPVTSGADDMLQDVLKTVSDQRVTDHHVRRLPVIDGRQLVGHERGSLGHEWRRGSAPCRHLQQLRLGGRLLI